MVKRESPVKVEAEPRSKIGCSVGIQAESPIKKPLSPGLRTSGTLGGGGGGSGIRPCCCGCVPASGGGCCWAGAAGGGVGCCVGGVAGGCCAGGVCCGGGGGCCCASACRSACWACADPRQVQAARTVGCGVGAVAGGCCAGGVCCGAGGACCCASACRSAFCSCAHPGKLHAHTNRQVPIRPLNDFFTYASSIQILAAHPAARQTSLAPASPNSYMWFASLLFCLIPLAQRTKESHHRLSPSRHRCELAGPFRPERAQTKKGPDGFDAARPLRSDDFTSPHVNRYDHAGGLSSRPICGQCVGVVLHRIGRASCRERV